MSADNWRTCPRCTKRLKDDHAAKLKAANEQYGKIPADEFRELIAEAEKPVEVEETLREDYEQGICDDGEYYVRFSASCQSCDYEFRYSHDEMTTV